MNGSACICLIRWPRLYGVMEGTRYEVEPAEAETPTSALFRAWCAGCGVEDAYPFRWWFRRRRKPLGQATRSARAESCPSATRPPESEMAIAARRR
jgi:hypothetical protein